jgi:outer membrane protein OmpA-like peptidoglycan-associated protein
MKKVSLFLIAILLVTAQVQGQDTGVGTTVLPLLKVGLGTRAAAMGGAYVGLSNDIGGLWWNPAGIDQLNTGDALFAHHAWFQGITDEYAGMVYPVTYKGTVGAGALLSFTNGIERWDEYNISPGGTGTPANYTPSQFSTQTGIISFAYAHRLIANRLSIGASLKGLYENLLMSKGFGGALDVGALFRPLSFLGIGLSVQNAGQMFYSGKSEMLPIAVRTGVAVNVLGFGNLLGDVNVSIDRPTSPNFHFGGEVSLHKIVAMSTGAESEALPQLFLRGGYQTGPQSLPDLGASGITAGLGVGYRNIRFEYVYTPYAVLGNTHRLALGVTFGKRPVPGAVVVQVIDGETRKPLGAILDLTGLIKKSAPTDSFTGRYTAVGLTSGMLKIKASSSGFQPAFDSVRVIAPDTAIKIVELYRTPPGSLKGHIYDVTTKKPLAATVDYVGIRKGSVGAPETGDYKTGLLPSGEYHLTVQATEPHYFPQDATVTVEPGKTAVKDFGLLREKEVIVLKDVYFEVGKADLLPESFPTLDFVGKLLTDNPKVMVELAGHTDVRKIESKEFPSNRELSQSRAESVKKYLVDKFSIDPNRLVAKGYGPVEPVASSLTEGGMSRNRRTEFRVLSGAEYYQEFKH